MKKALPYIYWFAVTCGVLYTYHYLTSKNITVYVKYDDQNVISPDCDHSEIYFKKCVEKP